LLAEVLADETLVDGDLLAEGLLEALLATYREWSGRAEVPHTFGMTLAGTLRMMSGLPFTIINTSTDPDQNGVLFDPLPAGEYSGNGANAITVDNDGGRNGAYGPGYIQLDMRFGWRWHVRGQQTLDLSLDMINLTNRSNFLNPTAGSTQNAADQRLTNFLLLTQLSGGGQPRQAQIGLRFGF